MNTFQTILAALIFAVVMLMAILVPTGVVTIIPLGIVSLLQQFGLASWLATLLIEITISMMVVLFFARQHLKHVPSAKIAILMLLTVPVLTLAYAAVGWLITRFVVVDYWNAVLLGTGIGVFISYHFLAHFAGIVYDLLEDI